MSTTGRNVKDSCKTIEASKGARMGLAGLATVDSKIPRPLHSTESTSTSNKSPGTKNVTPPSIKSVCRVKESAGDAVSISKTLFHKDTSPAACSNSQTVHLLRNAYEQRIHNIKQQVAAQKHQISRLEHHEMDQDQHSNAWSPYSSHHQLAVQQAELPQKTVEMLLHDARAEVAFLVQQLDETVAAHDAAEHDLAAAKTRLTTLTAETLKSKQQLAQVEQFSNATSIKVLQLQQQLGAASKSNQALTAEVLQLQQQQEAQLSDTALAACNAEVNRLLQWLQVADREKQALKQESAQLQHQLAVAAQSATAMATCRAELSDLQQQLAEAQESKQTAEVEALQLQQQLSLANANVSTCQGNVSFHKQAAEAAEARAEQAEFTALELQQQLDHFSGSLEAAQAEMADLQQKAVQAEQDSLAGAAMLLRLQQQLDERSRACSCLGDQVLQLQEEVAQVTQQRDAAVDELEQLQQQLQHAGACNDALMTAEGRADQLQQRLKGAEAAKHAAATEVLQLKEQLAKHEMKLHELEPRFQDSLQEAESAQQKVEQLERALEWSQYEKKAKKSLHMEQQIKQLQKQLKDSQAAHTDTRQQLHVLQQQQQQHTALGWVLSAGKQATCAKDADDHSSHADFDRKQYMNLQTAASDSKAAVELLQEELCRCRDDLQQAEAALSWAGKHKLQHLLGLGKGRSCSAGLLQQGANAQGPNCRRSCGSFADITDTAMPAGDGLGPVKRQGRLGGIKGLRSSSSGSWH